MVAPTIFLGLRMRSTTYLYDDPGHPDRPTGTIASPDYVAEDRALLVALQAYEADLCRCGQPRSVAWHTDMDGFYGEGGEALQVVCFACTAIQGGEKKVTYPVVWNTRPASKGPLPPFVLGVTTTDS
ncbi:hypothetical protein NPS01_25550 [Nocardioides psychrotolerans]|uniref:Uncharacterized protein n=1 Tax=Nocardioides psychrotolerans TaxID=1005945 RepID=A0A1I3LQW7_9ACTN|nr:hypothetical protein [Nocardioides psychrotolerans]GEP38892.1 hypothetical protein NPS01_25550 [Nocardioides psychrotolerans]SFI87082.1 hypothetical protein SAMN05216561_11460 [Nocardioides psychrotolerans]